MTTANLEPGTYTYAQLMDGVRRGRWEFARVSAASGRANYLIGLTNEQTDFLRREARGARVSLALLGSRVSGPRARQRSLHPVLAHALSLQATLRRASFTYPGADGVAIDKTVIKEHGLNSVHTSDLSIVLLDPLGRPSDELDAAAASLERRFRALETSFPLRVFAAIDGTRFGGESDFRDHGARYLREAAKGRFPLQDCRAAFSELYCVLALPSVSGN